MTGNIKKSQVPSHKSEAKRLKTICVVVFLICLISIRLFAQEISISARVDNNEITLDEMIVMTINISGNVRSLPDPKLPQLKDFDIYSSDRSQSISIINGRMSTSINFNYVLTPKKEGKYVVGPVEVNFGKKVYRTEPIPIEVLPSGKKQEVKSQVHPKTLTGETRNSGENIFIETSVNKKRAYLNEQVTLTFRFLTKIRLFGDPEYIPPDKNGFWSEDLPPQINYYEGPYLVTEIKTALFPTTAGKLTIGPATVKYVRGDIFEYLNDRKSIVLKTEPITIEVLPLPEEKLSNFKGAVGAYNIESEINLKEIEAGKPVNYFVKIKGKGNIKAVSEPDLGLSDDFKVYPAGSSDNIKKLNYTVQGEKTYEYYIIPKKPGDKMIPAINFTYFNPDIEKYITLKTKNIPITVKQGAVEEETTKENLLNTSSIKEEVRLLTKDIRPVKSDINLKHEAILLKNPLILLAISLPLFLFVLAGIYSKHQEQVEFNPIYKRDRRAGKLVQKRLKEAKKIMITGNKNEYCYLITKAILGFIGDKLNIAEMGLTSESLTDILKEKNISEDAQKKIRVFLDKCDFIKFSPIEPEQGWKSGIYSEAREIISFLEKQKWQKN